MLIELEMDSRGNSHTIKQIVEIVERIAEALDLKVIDLRVRPFSHRL